LNNSQIHDTTQVDMIEHWS